MFSPDFFFFFYYAHLQRRQWQPTPVLLPGEFHGWRSLVGCSPWGLEELDTTERLHFHFSLSCIGEGNGNPLQCFCLENPRDGEAWWAAISGVAQNWTRLKRLSNSSSSSSRAFLSLLWFTQHIILVWIASEISVQIVSGNLQASVLEVNLITLCMTETRSFGYCLCHQQLTPEC